MRRPIIAGNWKMHKSVDEALAFVREHRFRLGSFAHTEAVICPPAVSLPGLHEALMSSSVKLGAQNMHYAERGAFTGELSASMIKEFCDYVILGHSERRAMFAETDETVNLKVKAALKHGLVPIVCVGESLAQNETGQTDSFVGQQVQLALEGLSSDEAGTCVVAYEPIWAIGTGRSASAADAGRTISVAVRAPISKQFGESVAEEVRILYGGSAKASNIADYMSHPDIDGALVGGASLKGEFVDMVRITDELYRA